MIAPSIEVSVVRKCSGRTGGTDPYNDSAGKHGGRNRRRDVACGVDVVTAFDDGMIERADRGPSLEYSHGTKEAVMTVATMDEQTLKTILKAAIVEVLEERRDLVRDIIEEALEDAGLVAAIDEGLETGLVNSSDIFPLLDAA
jgi:hypothetical protein